MNVHIPEESKQPFMKIGIGVVLSCEQEKSRECSKSNNK